MRAFLRGGWNRCQVQHEHAELNRPFVVRSILLYSLEFWLFLKMQVQRLMVEHIKMIRWMCGDISLDRIKKEVVRERVGNTNTR